MSTLDYLKKIYKFNNKAKSFIVEIALDKYIDIFNEWDHSAFRKRDMDPDLEHFLRACSEEIPLKYDLEMWFYLPHENGNAQREKMIRNGITNYYESSIFYALGQLKRFYRNILSYTLAGVLFLSAATITEKSISQHMLVSVLMEGFYIGGWVFLWEAISTFFFEQRKISYKIKEFKRFLRAPITFKYEQASLQKTFGFKQGDIKAPLSLSSSFQMENHRQRNNL